MKRLGLICQFYYKSIILFILITVIMTVACFSLLYTVGVVKYANYTKDMFVEIIPENSYCIVIPSSFGDDVETAIENQQKLFEDLRENTLVADLAYMQQSGSMTDGENAVNILLFNDTMWENICSVLNVKSEEKSVATSCIVATPLYIEDENEQIISLRSVFPGIKGETLEIKPIAWVQYPHYIPSFFSSGTKMSANDFFSSGNYIVVEETEQMISGLKNLTSLYYGSSFFFRFRDDASKEEVDAVIQNLEKEFYVESVAEILTNTDELVIAKLSKSLPLPIFLLTVSSASFLSLSVLLLHKKEKEYAIYYLCGSSQKKGFILSFCALGIPAILAAALNIIFIVIYPNLLWKGVINFDGVLFSTDSILIVLLYLVCVIVICTLLPLLQQRKKSEIDIFRRT